MPVRYRHGIAVSGINVPLKKKGEEHLYPKYCDDLCLRLSTLLLKWPTSLPS